jgi:hypothetical protein
MSRFQRLVLQALVIIMHYIALGTSNGLAIYEDAIEMAKRIKRELDDEHL